MKYVALLRGINVGGNNLIKMAELKIAFEKAGFAEVITYINSGNVIFSSDKTDSKKLTEEIEAMLSRTFGYKARVVVKSYREIKETLENVPNEWNVSNDLRCYISFLTDFAKKEDIKGIPVREGVDKLDASPGILYMTTEMKQRTKSGFSRMIGQKIYKEMTIRNFTTVQKILALMEKI